MKAILMDYPQYLRRSAGNSVWARGDSTGRAYFTGAFDYSTGAQRSFLPTPLARALFLDISEI